MYAHCQCFDHFAHDCTKGGESHASPTTIMPDSPIEKNLKPSEDQGVAINENLGNNGNFVPDIPSFTAGAESQSPNDEGWTQVQKKRE